VCLMIESLERKPYTWAIAYSTKPSDTNVKVLSRKTLGYAILSTSICFQTKKRLPIVHRHSAIFPSLLDSVISPATMWPLSEDQELLRKILVGHERE
jgi:hypothetical protein